MLPPAPQAPSSGSIFAYPGLPNGTSYPNAPNIDYSAYHFPNMPAQGIYYPPDQVLPYS